jgi:flotillin
MLAPMNPARGAIDSGIDPADLAVWLGVGVAVVLGLLILTFVLTRFLFVCAPSEILIFSGRKHRLPDGSQVGFKVIHGGRAFRIPLLESVSRMDVRLFGVEVGVQNAFSKGGIPLTVHAIANVKIATDPRHVRQAVERFLGMEPSSIMMVARQTLEGVLREVLSQLTPEEVNEDRLKFAETLVHNAKDDFDKLGLQLDVLKVQHVSDDQKYLQNLGRARIAGMLRDAQNAENEALQRVSEEQAQARQRAESADQQGESLVLQKRNGFRAEIAKLEAEAKGIENEALVAAETSRATAEQELQRLRAELAKLQLQVDTVLPASAAAAATVARARGAAAPTIENGRAAAAALESVANEWSLAGEHAREVYVIQQLDTLVAAAVKRVEALEIGTLEVVDRGDGSNVVALLGSFARGVSTVLEETAAAVGVDVKTLLASHTVRPDIPQLMGAPPTTVPPQTERGVR